MSTNEIAGELGNVRIEPGLWEVRSAIVDVSAPNLPIAVRRRMIGPRATIRHCITPEQAGRPNAGFLAGSSTGRCTYRDFSMRGGRMAGTMICAGDAGAAPVETAMRGGYGPVQYDLRMEMRNPMPDGAVMTIQVTSRGRRIGACSQGRER